MNIISLGAGVQSTTMALMAAHGEITPMPDCAIFADTQDEPAAVYEHLRWLMSPNVLPFPVHVVSSGSLSERLFAGDDHARIPYHITSSSMGRRQCTQNYKVLPIRRRVRVLLGASARGPVRGRAVMWIGISLDEASRKKHAGVQFMINRWPLLEERMTRRDCIAWLGQHGYPIPPKSSCVYCPYKSDAQWRSLRNSPEDFKKAVAVDERLRSPENEKRFRALVFIHRSCVPLAEADMRSDGEKGQPDLFNNECEGMCGV